MRTTAEVTADVRGTESDALTGGLVHFHNLQLQKSPSRIFGQNSGNSVDISKAFFEMGIMEVRILSSQPGSHSARDCRP